MVTKTKSNGLEVSSSQLTDQFIEVKERLSAIETIVSLGNRKEVEAYVTETLTTPLLKKLMSLCGQPRTKADLQKEMDLKSAQALDYHLNSLRKDSLVEQQTNAQGLITIEWSRLFKGLPAKDRERLLRVAVTKAAVKRANEKG